MENTIYKTLDFLGCPEFRVGTDGSFWSRLGRRGRTDGKRGTESYITATWKQIPVREFGSYGIVEIKINGHWKTVSFHKLVLETFIGPCPPDMECCHNDGNPLNNKLSNLRWDTPQNNQIDRVKHGTDNRGENAKQSILNRNDITRAKELRTSGWSYVAIANLFSHQGKRVCPETISLAVRGKNWKHLSSTRSTVV